MKMSRLEAGTRIVLEFIGAFNRQNVSKMLECLSPDCVIESSAPAPHGTVYRSNEAIAQYWQDFFAQKDKLHLEVEEIFGLGYRCVLCYRLTWLSAQGKPETLRGAEIFKDQRRIDV